VCPKSLVEVVMASFPCQIKVHIPQGGQEAIRGIAFPGVSIGKAETKPVWEGEGSKRNQGSKDATPVTLLHDNRLFAFNKELRLDRFRVKSSDHDSLFAFARIGVGSENAVGVGMLSPDQPCHVLWMDIF
jgi:hypothetical protein